ncbi:hypothetical protein HBI36_229780 [Parastagonospora nodorum]|nr:hypothetical protein HBI36_229780 [Parastagonospora nodorum]
MCAKDDLIRRKGPFSNYVDTFSLDFAFSFAAWLQRIKCTLGDVDSLFADARLHDLHTRLLFQSGCNTDYPVRVYYELHSRDYTLLAGFIPTTKIRDPLLKSQVYHYCIGKLLLRKQCYPTICAILADYEEQVLLTGVKKNRYCTRCTLQQERCLNKGHDDFHHNFNIHVSLATDTLYLLLKGLVIKMLDFMQDMLDNIYPSKQKAIIQQLIAVVSPLFVLKAPFALHFIRAVCDLVTLAQYKSYDEDTLAYIQGALERMNVFKEEFRNFNYPKWHALTHIIQDIRMYRALDSICTRANSEAHYITIVKQFYSITNKKETALLAADYATIVKQSRPSTTVNIQDCTYSTRVTRPLPFRRLGCEVAANIAISNFIHAAAVFVSRMSVQIHSSIKCWRSSSKRHNDPEHCNEETGLWRRDYVWVQEFEHRDNRRQSRTVTDNGKHMAYIRAFSEVLLFNNNGQIDNTTRMLSVPFKFYDLSTIIRLVHLVPRDLPNLTTCTTMSYYVNNYID